MSRRYCFLGALITLLLASDAGLAAKKNSQREHSVRRSTYTAADGQFQFSYPANPQLFEKGHIGPSNDCDQDAIVCVVYSKSTRDGQIYGTSTFQVREVRSKDDAEMTADICATPYPRSPSAPEFMIDAKEPTKTISGILFVHGSQDVAAGPQSSGVDLYRAFHNGTCIELSIGDFGTDVYNDSAYDSENHLAPLTSSQKIELSQVPQILRSFRFLK